MQLWEKERMTPEGQIQREIEVTVSRYGGIPVRLQSGTFYTKQGVPIKIGIPGIPDLMWLLPNGRVVFCEVKTATGRLREDQRKFINALQELGYEAYVVRSKEEAESICAQET